MGDFAIGIGLGVCLGRALQGTPAQNFMVWSEDFTNAAWAKIAITATPAYAVGPDGITGSAQRLQIPASSQLYQYVTPLALGAGPFTLSVWLRSNTGGNQSLRLMLYDVLNNSFYSPNLVVTPSWQRFSVSATTPGSLSYSELVRNDTGNDAADVQAWGAQLNRGLSVITYSKTTSAINP
jgi:hypothetical protein